MATNTLDWTNAFIGRVTREDTAPYEARAEALAEKLKDEVGAGKLPAISMPYWDDLKVRLAAKKPYLERFEHMLVLGIGGSALGARALQKAFFPGQDLPGHAGPWLWIADNVDAFAMEAFLGKLPADKTVVVTISKSGGTIETISQYFLAKQWLQKHCGDAWNEHILVVTDEHKGYLRQEAEELGLESLPVPDNLGGRYSVLSAVGLAPAAFMGVDYEKLVCGALTMAKPLADPSLTAQTLAAHPSFRLAAWNAALMDKGYNQLIFFTYLPLWATFGAWFAQLWAESLGKEGKGSMPVPALGATDQHSVNQMFLDGPRDKGCLFLTSPGLPQGPTFPADIPDKWSHLKGRPFGDLLEAEGLGTQMALCKNQVPLVNLVFGDDGPEAAGRLMGLTMYATLLTGWMMGVNPIDQPAVELGKRLANARLGEPGYDAEDADLAAFLAQDRETQEF